MVLDIDLGDHLIRKVVQLQLPGFSELPDVAAKRMCLHVDSLVWTYLPKVWKGVHSIAILDTILRKCR